MFLGVGWGCLVGFGGGLFIILSILFCSWLLVFFCLVVFKNLIILELDFGGEFGMLILWGFFGCCLFEIVMVLFISFIDVIVRIVWFFVGFVIILVLEFMCKFLEELFKGVDFERFFILCKEKWIVLMCRRWISSFYI